MKNTLHEMLTHEKYGLRNDIMLLYMLGISYILGISILQFRKYIFKIYIKIDITYVDNSSAV